MRFRFKKVFKTTHLYVYTFTHEFYYVGNDGIMYHASNLKEMEHVPAMRFKNLKEAKQYFFNNIDCYPKVQYLQVRVNITYENYDVIDLLNKE